ncbi:MAG: hypothetical protein P1U63_13245 [Coxiellaceae bacterium]|nr:hypothetical protein [Coxiellaceae bacterium]
MNINNVPLRNNLVTFTVASMILSASYITTLSSSELSKQEKEAVLPYVYAIAAVGAAAILLMLTTFALYGYLRRHSASIGYDEFVERYKDDKTKEYKAGDAIDRYLADNSDVEAEMCNKKLLPMSQAFSESDEAFRFRRVLAANTILRKRAYVKWGLSTLAGVLLGMAASSQLPHALDDWEEATTFRHLGTAILISMAVIDVAMTMGWCKCQQSKPQYSLNTAMLLAANYGALSSAAPLDDQEEKTLQGNSTP